MAWEVTGSKAAASLSTLSMSIYPKASKELVSSKTVTVGTSKGKRKASKQPMPQPLSDTTASGVVNLRGGPLRTEWRVWNLGSLSLSSRSRPQTNPTSLCFPGQLPHLDKQYIIPSATPVVLVSHGAPCPALLRPKPVSVLKIWHTQPSSTRHWLTWCHKQHREGSTSANETWVDGQSSEPFSVL